jgi:hypothetical protein
MFRGCGLIIARAGFFMEVLGLLKPPSLARHPGGTAAGIPPRANFITVVFDNCCRVIQFRRSPGQDFFVEVLNLIVFVIAPNKHENAV